MEVIMFLKAIVIGCSVAAPVGPISVLVMKRTITQGQTYGLITGLAVAIADAIYAFISGIGISYISYFFIGKQFWFHLAGGIFLCYLGVKIYLSEVSENPANIEAKRVIHSFISTILLTLTNPMTIITFVGIFSGLGFSQFDKGLLVTLSLGIFSGSVLWWIFLCFVIGIFNKFLQKQTYIWINRLSGFTIIIFGVNTILKLY